MSDEMRCAYCKRACDGRHHDELGEYRMGRDDLVICGECKKHFDAEPFDHKDWA